MKDFILTKESHVDSEVRLAHFIVAIAYQKGAVLCEQYEDKINGDMFSENTFRNFQSTHDSK